MSKALITLGIVLAVIAVVAALALWLFGGRLLAPILGETEKQEIVNTGPARIQGYERFYDLYEEVKATDVKLSALPARLTDRQVTQCTRPAGHTRRDGR